MATLYTSHALSNSEIPKGIIYIGITSLMAMAERDNFKPKSLTSTCRMIAKCTLEKVDSYDKKLCRMLTNRLVSYAHENIEVFHV